MWIFFIVLLFGCSAGEGSTPPVETQAKVPDTPPPVSSLRTYHLAGILASGTFEGTVKLDLDRFPDGTDQFHLSPNHVYALVAWEMLVTPGDAVTDPPFRLTNDGQSKADLCIGKCYFDPRFFMRLKWSDGSHTLILGWLIDGLQPQPSTVAEWGSFEPNASELDQATYIMLVRNVTVAIE